ncbi:MAG: hypothetical protein SGBAC_012456 [Bacillariaceae sp.]
MSLPVFDRSVRWRRLKDIGFSFGMAEKRWHDMYQTLVQYHSVNGHFRVPEKENPKLCYWIIKQRQKRRGRKHCGSMTVTQIDLLDKIGFEWESDRSSATWMERYNELVDFRNQHGSLAVKHDGVLYAWMSLQRSKALTEEQVRLLDEIEFPWKPERLDAKWSAKYADLERFQKQYGHCQPLQRTNRKLQKWCYRQRNFFKEGSLSTEQIELLDKINFGWDVHGHLRVSEEDDSDLYDWVTIQRKRYHGIITKPRITDQQIENLECVHFCWSLDWRERKWHETYTEVAEYYKEHGHVRVIQKDNPSLYNWIQMQEKRYKETKGHKPLSEEELEHLEQIDFPFLEDQPRMAWNKRLAQLNKYRKENGELFPSHNDDPELNRWMRHQRYRVRSSYGHAPLSDEQKSMLESIDFPMLPTAKILRLWYESYDELAEFRKTHGHLAPGPSNKLYGWIEAQRDRYKTERNRPMKKLELYLLERIGFAWASERAEVMWQEMFDNLVQFQNEHGHMQVKRLDHPTLYSWMKSQRARYKAKGSSELPSHRIKQLKTIGFRWTGPF